MEIRPFKAYRFNPAVVGNIGACIAPPYDLIDPWYQEELYNRSPYNIIRIEKGRELPTDDTSQNVYTRAAAELARWIDEGVLIQDSRQAIYGYIQQYQLAGRTYTRYSFIALGRLVPFGPVVRPHEQVFPGPVEDRLRLKRATAAQLGLVFMLYDDQQRLFEQIAQGLECTESLIDIVDDHGVRHIVTAVADQGQIKAICTMMKDKSCIIADGHHRYTTGLQYAKESGLPDAQFQMMAFANIRQEGLSVLATHRVVRGIPDPLANKLVERLQEYFLVDRLDDLRSLMMGLERLAKEGRIGFGVYMGKDQVLLASLRDQQTLRAASPGKEEAWYGLDVVALQVLVMERILNLIPQARDGGPQVEYITSLEALPQQATDLVDKGDCQVAFILNPIRIQQLVAIANAGLLMPPKSTFFYPKMYTGLTIQRLEMSSGQRPCKVYSEVKRS
ncbi:MAG: DUF1015 domain-containing protein [Sedimentisphaerales bacterium]|nr:DUF1015 domain-containing protein [Sedimentisphaerales bacterium]